jgi:hypothetical protein
VPDSTESSASRAGTHVIFPDGQRVAARYALLDASDLQPSHIISPVLGVGRRPSVRRNPDRRGLVRNTREYEGRRGRRAAELVFEHMQPATIEPDHLLDGTRFVTTGPPVISTSVPGAQGDGIVVAGNHRAMVLRGAASAMSGDAFAVYRKALLEYLRAHPHIGIDPSFAESSQMAVLVREISDPMLASDVARLDYLNVISDWPITKAMDPASMADAMATGLRQSTRALEHLAATFPGTNPDGSTRTLAAWLNSNNAALLVEIMDSDGAVSPMLRAMLVHPKTGRLSVHGRHMVSQMLFAAAVENADALDTVSLEYLKRIEAALPVLATSPDTSAWREMREAVGAALEYFHESTIDDVGRLDGMDDLLAPTDPIAKGIAELLHHQGGEELASRVRGWAAALEPHASPQAAPALPLRSPDSNDSLDLFEPAVPLASASERTTNRDHRRLMAEHFAAPLERRGTDKGLAWILNEVSADPKKAAHQMSKLVPKQVWNRISPLLDPPRRGGRTNTMDRSRIAAIVLLRRHGIRWRNFHRWWRQLPKHQTGPDGDAWNVGGYSGFRERLSRWRSRENGAVWAEVCRELNLREDEH